MSRARTAGATRLVTPMMMVVMAVATTTSPRERKKRDQQNGKEREEEEMRVRIKSVGRHSGVRAWEEIMRREHPDDRCDDKRDQSNARQNVQPMMPAPIPPLAIIALRLLRRRRRWGFRVIDGE